MDAAATNPILDRLKEGARRFQAQVHAGNAEQYLRLSQIPQTPHTLVIACSDSRVAVEAITGARPGEVFVARNIGNLVPAYGEIQSGVSAVVEYAISALKVQHVMICGHSDCGAMKALLAPETTETLPAVRSWLANGPAALQVAESFPEPEESPSGKLARLTEENVLLQIDHLKTHPSVVGALARQELTISGWVYEIADGSMRVAEDGQRVFLPATVGA